jgi:hypothetical protein
LKFLKLLKTINDLFLKWWVEPFLAPRGLCAAHPCCSNPTSCGLNCSSFVASPLCSKPARGSALVLSQPHQIIRWDYVQSTTTRLHSHKNLLLDCKWLFPSKSKQYWGCHVTHSSWQSCSESTTWTTRN